MAGKKLSREKYVVRHSNWLEPEDLLRFIHFDGFTRDWKDLGLDDEDLRFLQLQIMLQPQAGAVVPGTGGLRKMRIAPLSWKRGKRGGIRLLYAIYPDFSVAVLAAAFVKNEQADITPAEKRILKSVLEEIGRILEQNESREQSSSD